MIPLDVADEAGNPIDSVTDFPEFRGQRRDQNSLDTLLNEEAEPWRVPDDLNVFSLDDISKQGLGIVGKALEAG